MHHLEAFFVSIALSRHPDGIEFLLQKIRDNSPRACAAVKSLAPVRFYPEITEKVEAAVNEVDDRLVTETFRSCFAE